MQKDSVPLLACPPRSALIPFHIGPSGIERRFFPPGPIAGRYSTRDTFPFFLLRRSFCVPPLDIVAPDFSFCYLQPTMEETHRNPGA